jgi:dTDP-4-amino-4,6-dideoxygalactose transaminase
MTIPLAVPNLNGNETRYLAECVATNFVSSVGPFVGRFEEMVAAACATPGAVATASGTAALHAMLAAHNIDRGDLVVTPALSFIATANAIRYTGAEPAFLDVSAESWTLDPAAVEDYLARGGKAAAILTVHTLGHPSDMDALEDIARRRNIPLLCDGAAALGATYRGKPVCARGAATALSFNGNKTVTSGGGGAIVSQDKDFLARVKHLTTTARRGEDYDHDQVGFNYRMTNIQAAVGCAQMERAAELVAAKRHIARRYAEAFAGLPVALFPEAKWAGSANWFGGIVLAGPARDFVRKLNAEGIGARPFWKPLHTQKPYLDCTRGDLKVTESVWDRIVTLPCSTGLTESEQSRVIDAVTKLVRTPVGVAE